MTTTPTELIESHADEYPDDIVARATGLADADESWTRGAKPSGVAAAAVYMAFRLERPWMATGSGTDSELPTQREVADTFDTTHKTLRNRLDDLRERMAAENDEAAPGGD